MLIVAIVIAILSSLGISFLIAQFTTMLDYALDYGGYLWKWRYAAAMRYVNVFGDDALKIRSEELSLKAKNAKYSDQPAIMDSLYQEISSKHWKFGRWICSKCIATYIGMWVASIVTIIGIAASFYFCICALLVALICASIILIMPFYYISK